MKSHQAERSKRAWFGGRLSVLFAFLALVDGLARSEAWAVEVGPVTVAPGEWNKTVPGVNVSPGDSLVVHTSVPAMVCRIPSIAQWKTAMQEMANSGMALRDALNRMERETGDGSPESIARAIMSFYPPWTGLVDVRANGGIAFRANYQQTQSAWSSGQPLTLVYGSSADPNLYVDCLLLSDAQTLVLRMREIVRRYLAMPPITVPLERLPPPAR